MQWKIINLSECEYLTKYDVHIVICSVVPAEYRELCSVSSHRLGS